MLITPGRYGLAWNGGRSRWNDDRSLGMTFSDGIINRCAIVGTVSGQRAYRSLDLIEQISDRRDIADIVRGQFDGDDLMGISVDGNVKFPPPAARPDPMLLVEPFAFAIDLDAGAVDQDMQRFVAHDPLWQKVV